MCSLIIYSPNIRLSMYNASAYRARIPTDMDRYQKDLSNVVSPSCCSTGTSLPPPSSFSEDTIQRQLGHLLDRPCLSGSPHLREPSARVCRPHIYRPVHTAVVPALLYVPAYYVPIYSSCFSNDRKCVGSSLRCENITRMQECVRCNDACGMKQSHERSGRYDEPYEKIEVKVEPRLRGRDEWDCDFCGFECFCERF